MSNNLVEKFCTPPDFPLTDCDRKALTGSEKMECRFEGKILPGYSWGKGRTIILVHGWGSRASHLALMGRYLAQSGFKVIAFDAPAHSSIKLNGNKTKSNMFEFCKAISSVAKTVSPVYAVIGHSLGAAASAFTVSGYSFLRDYAFPVKKIVLISSPLSIKSILYNFSVHNNLDSIGCENLQNALEKAFNFSADEFCVGYAMKNLDGDVLLVHDKNDEEIHISEMYEIHKSIPNAIIFITEGSGHQKILINRTLFNKLAEFLKERN